MATHCGQIVLQFKANKFKPEYTGQLGFYVTKDILNKLPTEEDFNLHIDINE